MSIKVKNLTHIYMQDTTFEQTALNSINLEIEQGEFVGLIGHTGSGKSTLIQHLNGLLKPTAGSVIVDGVNINDKTVGKKDVRQKVGLVFQYPEHQIFEETVYKDVAFGPKNLGLEGAQIEERVQEAIEIVGLDYDNIKNISPFELSGGQKRRVAIAGVIAMKPKVLILDEPTAGLDPKGRDEILKEIKKLHENNKMTVILVSHSMEDIAKLVERIIVMSKGQIILSDEPSKVFDQVELLEKIGLGVPQVTYLTRKLRARGFNIGNCISIEEAEKELYRIIRGK